MNKSQAARLEGRQDGIVENQSPSVANNKSGAETFGPGPENRRLSLWKCRPAAPSWLL